VHTSKSFFFEYVTSFGAITWSGQLDEEKSSQFLSTQREVNRVKLTLGTIISLHLVKSTFPKKLYRVPIQIPLINTIDSMTILCVSL
jgi:hypothetical protein